MFIGILFYSLIYKLAFYYCFVFVFSFSFSLVQLRPGVRQVPEDSEELRKMEETGFEIICGAPMTPRG